MCASGVCLLSFAKWEEAQNIRHSPAEGSPPDPDHVFPHYSYESIAHATGQHGCFSGQHEAIDHCLNLDRGFGRNVKLSLDLVDYSIAYLVTLPNHDWELSLGRYKSKSENPDGPAVHGPEVSNPSLRAACMYDAAFTQWDKATMHQSRERPSECWNEPDSSRLPWR